MERRPGRPLLEHRGLGMAGVLVRAQRRLHALDPEPVRQAIEAAVLAAPGRIGGRALAHMEARISSVLLSPALGWLRANRPTLGALQWRHGDYRKTSS
jgi:hypothetical protein